jgi:hypothetical protein
MRNDIYTITYDNGYMNVADTVFRYSILEKEFPEYAEIFGTNIKSIEFVAGKDNNKVIYKDGSQKELPKDTIELDLFFASRFLFRFQDQQAISRQRSFPTKSPLVTLSDIFVSTNTDKDRQRLIDLYESETGREIKEEEIEQFFKGYKRRALASSDWTQLEDVNLEPELKKQWQDYRQQLRDLSLPDNPLYNLTLPSSPPDSLDN